MKKLAITFAFTTAFLLGTATHAYGQSDQEIVTVQWTVPTLLMLDVDANLVTIPVTTADVGTTISNGGSSTLSFKGNLQMDLDLSPGALSQPAGGSKAASDLKWNASGTGVVTAAGDMGAASPSFATGIAPGDYTLGNGVDITYDLVVNWDDLPGPYSIPVTYTLTGS